MQESEETQTSDDGASQTTSDSSSVDTPTPTTNGDGKSQTSDQKIDAFVAKLDKYMDERLLPRPKARRIDDHLNLTRHQLGLLSEEDVQEIAYEVYAYALYLQNVINHQQAKADRCKFEIERLVGPRLGNYRDCYGKEEKWIAAINDDGDARRFRECEVNSRIAATRLSYLVTRLDNLAKCLMEMKHTKRR